jgi:DNA-binding transcriptional LysR family regulator
LKIAAPVVFGRLHVLPIVGRMLRQHREVAVALMLSDRNVHLLEESVDVAVRVGELADSSLIAVKLGVLERVVVASPGYLKQRGEPKSPAQLAGHDIVAFEGIGAVDQWRFHPGGRPLRFEPKLTVNSIDASIAAAEAGIGITRVLSYQVKASVTAGRLMPILQQFAPPPSPVHAIYPARRVASANVAAFVAAARDYFKAHPLVPVGEWRLRQRR